MIKFWLVCVVCVTCFWAPLRYICALTNMASKLNTVSITWVFPSVVLRWIFHILWCHSSSLLMMLSVHWLLVFQIGFVHLLIIWFKWITFKLSWCSFYIGISLNYSVKNASLILVTSSFLVGMCFYTCLNVCFSWSFIY